MANFSNRALFTRLVVKHFKRTRVCLALDRSASNQLTPAEQICPWKKFRNKTIHLIFCAKDMLVYTYLFSRPRQIFIQREAVRWKWEGARISYEPHKWNASNLFICFITGRKHSFCQQNLVHCHKFLRRPSCPFSISWLGIWRRKILLGIKAFRGADFLFNLTWHLPSVFRHVAFSSIQIKSVPRTHLALCNLSWIIIR